MIDISKFIFLISLCIISKNIIDKFYSANMNVSHTDLENLINNLWVNDENMCLPGIDYSLNLQGKLSPFSIGKDLAKSNLFQMFDENRVFNRPTYKLFKKLLDNYEMQTGVLDVVTNQERNENDEFINSILETKVMKILHQFLINHQLISPNIEEFKKELMKIWFDVYKRSNVPDSCGFEHVFVGELKNDQIIGLHNWLQIYLQEKVENINYHGFFEHGTSNESKNPRIITIQFIWRDGQTKPHGSSFIGTSPEFEMAFFSALHFCNPDSKAIFKMDHYNLNLIHYKKQNQIASSYIKGLD